MIPVISADFAIYPSARGPFSPVAARAQAHVLGPIDRKSILELRSQTAAVLPRHRRHLARHGGAAGCVTPARHVWSDPSGEGERTGDTRQRRPATNASNISKYRRAVAAREKWLATKRLPFSPS